MYFIYELYECTVYNILDCRLVLVMQYFFPLSISSLNTVIIKYCCKVFYFCQMDQFNLVFPKEQFDFKTIADNCELLYIFIEPLLWTFLCLMKLDMST